MDLESGDIKIRITFPDLQRDPVRLPDIFEGALMPDQDGTAHLVETAMFQFCYELVKRIRRTERGNAVFLIDKRMNVRIDYGHDRYP